MARRQEWTKRIEQWAESGLTGAEFAHEIGVKEATLRHWKWRLDKLARTEGRTPTPPRSDQFVELLAPTRERSETSTVVTEPEPFELVLSDGLRVRVGARFDPDALRRLLHALGDR